MLPLGEGAAKPGIEMPQRGIISTSGVNYYVRLSGFVIPTNVEESLLYSQETDVNLFV